MHPLDKYPPITAEREDSFARLTVEKRFPKIIADIKKHNPGKYEQELDAILEDKFIRQVKLPDSEKTNWEDFFKEYENESWYKTPFFFLELYFYKRINILFRDEDPFRKSKQEDLIANPLFLKQVDSFYSQLDQASLRDVILLSLWGNKADLSLLNRIDQTSKNATFSDDNLLIDHSADIEAKLKSTSKRIDIVLDNAGIELLTDLIFVDYILKQFKISEVVLHFKSEPVFVSDALIHDFYDLLEFISTNNSLASLKQLVINIKSGISENRIIINSNFIWGQPVHLYKPEFGFEYLFDNTNLIILKGDANYRRILGDKNIPFTTSDSILDGVYSKNIAAFRTLKSEIIIHISEEIINNISNFSNQWCINGSKGVVYYI
jgi:uncharacterized protein with ATP-grasp and redox domains